MASKLRIKVGSLEVDYEGTDEFIERQFPALLKTLQELKGFRADLTKNEGDVDDAVASMDGTTSTNTIAQKLGSKTGSDLARAAAARFRIVLKRESFTKKELLAEMRSAKSYYRKSYRNNLDNYLKTLTDNGTLLLQGENTYAVAAEKATELAAQLGKR